jgi:hypothetical protein
VHLSVRAESKHGKRLNPRKADLHRWRETFAEKLRGWGIDAEATRQASRGVDRNYPSLWRKKAAEEGRERKPRPERKERVERDGEPTRGRSCMGAHRYCFARLRPSGGQGLGSCHRAVGDRAISCPRDRQAVSDPNRRCRAQSLGSRPRHR